MKLKQNDPTQRQTGRTTRIILSIPEDGENIWFVVAFKSDLASLPVPPPANCRVIVNRFNDKEFDASLRALPPDRLFIDHTLEW